MSSYTSHVAKLRRDQYQMRLAPVIAADPLAYVERITRGQIVRKLLRGAVPLSPVMATTPQPDGTAHLYPEHTMQATPETLDDAARLVETLDNGFMARLLRQCATSWRTDLAELASTQRENTIAAQLAYECMWPDAEPQAQENKT